MKTIKRMASFLLIAAMLCALAVPAGAATVDGGSAAALQKAAENEAVGTTGQKYRDWFYGKGKNTSAAWCAIFVSWCANEAGIPQSVIAKSAACSSMRSAILKNGGKTVTSPKAGDLVFYYDNNSYCYAHVGIMVNSTESVQGNLKNQVQRVSKVTNYNLGYSDAQKKKNYKVVYVRPNYGVQGTCKVTTGEAADITKTSATLHGYVSGNVIPSEIGMYWGTSKDDLKKLGSDTTTGTSPHMWYSTSKYYGALSSGKTYYYQGYAIVHGQTVRGEVKSFKTAGESSSGETPPVETPTTPTIENPPVSCTVTTDKAADVTAISATLHGYVSSEVVPSEIGMYWGTSKTNLKKLGSDTTKSKSPHMWYSTSKYYGALTPGKTYYYQAYAVVNGTTVRGSIKCFKTTDSTTCRIGAVKGTSTSLRIRKGPGTSYTTLGYIPEGAKCTVDTSKSSGNWYWVVYNGISGYSSKNYIKLQ